MNNIKKILCPTDFSPCAEAAFDQAAALAKLLTAEIVLLHVVPEVQDYFLTPDMVPIVQPVTAAARNWATDQLDKARRRASGVPVTSELRMGPMLDSILASAVANKVDLIVVGTHGRTGLKHALLGSVAERIVRHSVVPVLTVRKPA
jgi:universal stress protein A